MMKADLSVSLASLSPFDSVLAPVYGMTPLTFRVNLPCSAKLGWKHFIDALRYVSPG